MKMLLTTLALGLGVISANPVLAADAAQPDLAHGQKLFQYWCATCHGPDARESGRLLPGTASLAVKYKGEKPAALEQRDDLVAPFTTHIMRRGSEGMPFFRKTEISDPEMNDIAAYLARNVK